MTFNARNLSGIPEVIPELHGETNLHASSIEVRGEVYMTLHDFQEFNENKVIINQSTTEITLYSFGGVPMLIALNSGYR